MQESKQHHCILYPEDSHKDTKTVFYPNRIIYADYRDTKTGLAKKRQCYILMSDNIYAEKDDSYALYFSTIARQSL